jgi:hypothetical protein
MLVTARDGSQSTEITVFRTSSGQVTYSINWSSFHTSDPAIDNVSTDQLVDVISDAAVQKGVELGYTKPTSGATVETSVWSETCLYRMGSGANTKIVVDPNCTSKDFESYKVDFSTSYSAPAVIELEDYQPACVQPAPAVQ